MLCAGRDGGFQSLLRVGCTAERRRRDVRIYELAQQLLRFLLCGGDLRLKKLRTAENISLNGGIFFIEREKRRQASFTAVLPWDTLLSGFWRFYSACA